MANACNRLVNDDILFVIGISLGLHHLKGVAKVAKYYVAAGHGSVLDQFLGSLLCLGGHSEIPRLS